MKQKIIIIYYLILTSFISVNAETLTEKISNLSSEVTELYQNVIDSSTLLEKLYPVGSIYISSVSTNPGSIFGGTWEIYADGKQLIGSGSNGATTYTAGTTGGTSSVTLAIANLPSHSHNLTPAGTVKSTFSGSQVTTSSSGAHTHYLSWVHTAATGESTSQYGLGYGYTTWKDKVIVTAASGTTSLSSSNFSTSTHTVTPKGTVSSTFTGKSATTSSTGSGTSFNIQNPYIKVYMWKRTA